jgi:hypothetical protein
VLSRPGVLAASGHARYLGEHVVTLRRAHELVLVDAVAGVCSVGREGLICLPRGIDAYLDRPRTGRVSARVMSELWRGEGG